MPLNKLLKQKNQDYMEQGNQLGEAADVAKGLISKVLDGSTRDSIRKEQYMPQGDERQIDTNVTPSVPAADQYRKAMEYGAKMGYFDKKPTANDLPANQMSDLDYHQTNAIFGNQDSLDKLSRMMAPEDFRKFKKDNGL